MKILKLTEKKDGSLEIKVSYTREELSIIMNDYVNRSLQNLTKAWNSGRSAKKNKKVLK